MNESEYIRRDVYEKDLDMLTEEIANLNRRLDDMKSFVGWCMAVLSMSFVLVQMIMGLAMYLLG